MAIVRGIPDSFARATVRHPHPEPIDVGRARGQHAAYVAALAGLGIEIVQLEADERHPDCCFVEDMAVVAGGHVLATRSGNPARRGEGPVVARALEVFLPVTEMAPPATLDGGDVLRVGRTLFVGATARTNRAGIAALAEVYEPLGYVVVPVQVPDALHLKSLCSSPAPQLVLLAEGTLDPGLFTGVAEVVLVPSEEAYAANTVGSEGWVLVPAGHPRTTALLVDRGLEPIPLEVGEIAKADGALTCQSILF